MMDNNNGKPYLEMSGRPYRICTRCVMDTADPYIRFDDRGICNHCLEHDKIMSQVLLAPEEMELKLREIVSQIKEEGSGKKYDCVIGVSGGVDSTYVAYMIRQLGLKPLAVHLDNGWDAELAVQNIENAMKKLNIDLYTVVLDWEEFKDLQLSFLKASTPDSEIPTDHAIVASMRHTAAKIGVRYIITGYNVKTETHLPPAWSQGHYDWKYIKSIQKKFGTVPLRTYPHLSYVTSRRYLRRQKMVNILDYMHYVKKEAMGLMEKELNWQYYGEKHFESIYTRFYQGYLLPTKFGYDKRKVHYSSLICSGQMMRNEALEALKKPPYPLSMQKEDVNYVIKKIDITEEEFDAIMKMPRKSFWDYPSYARMVRTPLYHGLRSLYRLLKGTQ
jgi:N-acetyl sugar amidotransferase